MHLIRLGRLGTTVRKARLLCTVQNTNDDNQFMEWQSSTNMNLPVLQVSYLRIEWAGW
jgi:tRNA splicing endonuclease